MAMAKSSIGFGMVYIPITYTTLLKNNSIDFKLLDKKTKSRVKYKKVCEADMEHELLQKDIVKGYEYEEDKYVIFEPKEFEKLKTKKDKSIVIEKFVDINEIDPIYYDKPYMVESIDANHAFSLLAHAMENKNKVGIAKTVLGQRENLIIIRAKNNKLYFNSLFFQDEIKDYDKEQKEEKFSKEEIKMAETLIDNMSSKFNINEYKDEYQEKLKKAINQKIAGKKVTKPKEKSNQKKISNLMDALTESIKATKKGKK